MQAFHGGKTIQKNHLGRRRFNLTTVMKVMDDEETQKNRNDGRTGICTLRIWLSEIPDHALNGAGQNRFDSVMRVVVEQ
jgi:hypothetical protein